MLARIAVAMFVLLWLGVVTGVVALIVYAIIVVERVT